MLCVASPVSKAHGSEIPLGWDSVLIGFRTQIRRQQFGSDRITLGYACITPYLMLLHPLFIKRASRHFQPRCGPCDSRSRCKIQVPNCRLMPLGRQFRSRDCERKGKSWVSGRTTYSVPGKGGYCSSKAHPITDRTATIIQGSLHDGRVRA